MLPAHLQNRFWSKVDKRSDAECWAWKGTITKLGYGLFFYQIDGVRKRLVSHRIAWELRNGSDMPADLLACHACDNRACVNPNHIWPGTYKDNMQDMVKKRRGAWHRQTHCKRGHPLEGENLMRAPSKPTKRICRECSLIYRAVGLERKRTTTPVLRSAPTRTHCRRGHAFTEENTLIRTSYGYSRQVCRECKRMTMKIYRARAASAKAKAS